MIKIKNGLKRLSVFLFGSKKRIILSSIGIVIFGIICWMLFGQTKPHTTYQTATVAKGSIIATVSESGSVEAANEVNVVSPTDGVITAIYVKNGDSVSAGQNLFTVKSTSTPQQQAQAYASYLSAQNTLNSAKSDLNSLQEALFKANQTFVTDKGTANPDTADPVYIEEKAAWQQAEANYTNQQGIINQAEVSLNAASLAYAATQDSTVTAPTNGTVANLSATVGSNVIASNNTSSTNNSSSTSSPVLVLGNFSNLMIQVPVSEIDVTNVHAGDKATITLDALPGTTFVGTVTSIDTIGTTNSGVVTYNAYITLIDPPTTIKPGMSATAVIQTNRKDDVLYVPTSAIQTIGGSSYVRVMQNGNVSQVPVTTGIASDSDTEITSGLTTGQTIVTSEITTGGKAQQTGSPFGGSGFGGARGFGGGVVRVRAGG